MKKLFFVAVFLVVLCGAATVGATGIGGRPANPHADNPRSQSIFIFSFEDGKRNAGDELLVANNTDQKNTIELYATDGAATNTGAFTCKQRVEASTDIGSWIKLERTSVTLEPNTNTKVPFTITPAMGANPGEHTGCIVMQRVGGGDNDRGVNLQVRSAVRVVALLPGELFKQVGIKDFRAREDGRSYRYDFTLTNKGNVSADVRASVLLKSLFGDLVAKVTNEYPVLREGKLDAVYEMDDLPFWGGFYVAYATAEYDARPYMFGTRESSPLSKVTSEKRTVFIMPHPVAILLVLLVIGLVILLVVMCRKWQKSRRVGVRATARKGHKKRGLSKTTKDQN